MVDGSLIFNTKMDNTQFNKNINSVNKSFSQSGEKIKSILNDTERSAKSKAASIAAEYRKMGQSQTEAMKNAWAQIERNTSDSSAKVKKTTEDTGDSFTGMADDLLNSSDFITMALKLVVSGFKKVGQTAESIANGVWNSSVKIGQSIGYASAEIGKFTLKQFIGDWENQSSGFNKMLMMGASAFSIYRLFNFGREGVELASDLEEVQNVVDVAFSSMSDSVNKWALDAKKSYGLSETMAKKYVGLYGSMSKQFGFTERKAFDMSTTLAGFAGDVASFYNITQDEAYTKLKSVFSGETETLKDIGVVMTQNALDAYALANGYNKTTAEMSEMEKVSLRYNYVVDTLNNVTGDYVRTQHSWANQIRQLQLNCQELQATVGKGAINALTPAITILNVFIEKLQTAAEWFEILMTSIFGDSSESSGGVTEFADGAENAAGAIDSITDSAKNLNQTLASFDELNVMSDNEKETDIVDVQTEILEASGIISEAVSNTKDEAEKTLSSIEFADAVREAVKSGNWYNVGALISKALAGQLENITWDDIQATSVDIAKNIADFINGALSEEEFWQEIGKTIGKGLNVAVKFLLTLLENIEWGNVGVSVGLSINELIGTFDAEEYGKLAAERINAIFSFIAGAVNTVEWENLGTEAGEGLSGYFSGLSKGITYTDENGNEVTTTIPQTIANLLNGIVKAGLALFTYKDPETGENIFSVFGTKLGQGLQEFIETFEIKDGVLLAKNIIDAFVKFLYNAFEELDFTELGIEFSDSINDWLSDSEWWSDTGGMVDEIADDILNFLITVISNIDVDAVDNAMDAFFSKLDVGAIGSKIGGLIGLSIIKAISSVVKDVPILGDMWRGWINSVLVPDETSKKVWENAGFDIDGILNNILGNEDTHRGGGGNSLGETLADNISTGYSSQIKKKAFGMRESTVEATQISILGAKTTVDNDTSIETAFKNKGTDSRNALVDGFDKTATEEHFSDVWTGIQDVFFNVDGWFKKIFGEAWDDVKSIFSDKDGISNIRQSVEDVFKNVLNDFIEGINNAIANPFDSLNNTLNILRTFEFANQKVFSWIPNIPVPRIPKLATGTVVPASYGEFLAVLGDNKREAEVVSPISTMKKAVLEALEERGYNGTGGDIHITLTMPDGSVLFRTVVDEAHKYKKSNGKSAFA